MASSTKPDIRWTSTKKEKFLSILREVGIIRMACEAVNASRSGYYRYIKTDPEFLEEVKIAQEEAIELLEQKAMERARDGWEEPVWYQGMQVGSVRRYSDTLAIFMLKGGKPEKYRERQEHIHHATIEKKVVYFPSNGREKESD